MARPVPSFHTFIGQRRLVAFLCAAIAGARARGEALLNLLLVGRSGFGKSALARAIPAEYFQDASAGHFSRLWGGRDLSVGKLCEQLRELSPYDVLFIDEAHALSREAHEALYVALDEQRTLAVGTGGKVNRAKTESVASFTLVLATNCPGELPVALRERLFSLEFDAYSVGELKAIASQVAARVGMTFTGQAARVVAERSQGVPREVEKHVLAMGQVLAVPAFATGDLVRIEQPAVMRYFAQVGIDEHGLSPDQRKLLGLLAGSRRRQLTQEVLAAQLGTDPPYLRTEVEPFLVQLGLVEMTSSRLRTITYKGLELAASWPVEDDDDVDGGGEVAS